MSDQGIVFSLEGRGFTLHELKKAILQCSKGYLNDFYRTCWNMLVWELIEAIELVAEIHEDKADSGQQDIFEHLGVEL